MTAAEEIAERRTVHQDRGVTAGPHIRPNDPHVGVVVYAGEPQG
jgi:hypothetical protein